MSDDDWCPGSGVNTSISPDEEEYRPKPTRRRSPRRKSADNKTEKVMISEEDDEVIIPPKTRRRSSTRRKSVEKKKKVPDVLDLGTSSDENTENVTPLKVIEVGNTKKKRRSSSLKTTKMDIDENDGDDEEDEPDVPPPKEIKTRGTKRKSNELKDLNLNTPTTKKRKLSPESSDNGSSDDTTTSVPESTKKSKATNPKKTVSKSSKVWKSSKTTKSTKCKSKKSGTLKGQDATHWIREFMLKQNRPHSKSSLKNEIPPNTVKIGDAQINKSLDELKEEKVLCWREFGKKAKTRIYWRNQELIDDFNPEDAEREEQEMKEMEKEINEKKRIYNQQRKEINALKSEPTDKQLQEMQKEKGEESATLTAQLNELEGDGAAKRVTAEDIDRALVGFKKWGDAWKERRRLTFEMIDAVWGECNKTPKKVLTVDVRGETDEENGVQWEEYKKIHKDSGIAAQRAKDQKRRK